MLRFLQKTYEAWIDYPQREGALIAGTYVVEHVLGEGSYGITYLCRDVRSGIRVAVKMARPSKGALGERLLAREAEVLGSLRYPGIPHFIEMIRSGKKRYLVSEYVEGLTMEQLIFEQGKVFDESDVLEWTLRLLELVRHVHEKGYAHLDIRIPNVIVRGERLALIDFGLARRMGEEIGPELCRFWQEGLRITADAEKDLYDIGHFMLFMLYSSYDGPCERSGWSGRHNAGKRESGWQDELTLTPGVRRILRKLLQIDPPYGEVRQLTADLRNVLAGNQLE
ncbi:serine/threonine protein kinase [Paenibacillus hamazuiensis]|uniref:serine/threonine protein kinase n=1 Tax=Paenibacillus hamazuiensis TaxID=2936508 RepID=UPI002010B143|nr:protein kinase family protein [Paenibacillus hamazuiensis]